MESPTYWNGDGLLKVQHFQPVNQESCAECSGADPATSNRMEG